jgi:hypothetical protein
VLLLGLAGIDATLLIGAYNTAFATADAALLAVLVAAFAVVTALLAVLKAVFAVAVAALAVETALDAVLFAEFAVLTAC